MTDQELDAIALRQKAATPDGRVIFESDIIENDVPALIAEVRRLRHIISEKPDIAPPIRGEAIERFQRLWEACVGLVEKADFKALFRYALGLEEEIQALEAKLAGGKS